MELTGKVALVTGGASGLGLATVRRLHAGGAAVVIIDQPCSAGEDITATLGDRVDFAAADVRKEAEAAYSASKAGIAGMTLPIARDLAC